MIMGAYCVGKGTQYVTSVVYVTGAYCAGKAHNMLPQYYYDNRSILCTQYATLGVL